MVERHDIVALNTWRRVNMPTYRHPNSKPSLIDYVFVRREHASYRARCAAPLAWRPMCENISWGHSPISASVLIKPHWTEAKRQVVAKASCVRLSMVFSKQRFGFRSSSARGRQVELRKFQQLLMRLPGHSSRLRARRQKVSMRSRY